MGSTEKIIKLVRVVGTLAEAVIRMGAIAVLGASTSTMGSVTPALSYVQSA